MIGAFYDVHRNLGFGFLETIYARALEKELFKRGHRVQRELGVPVFYDGEPIGWHRLDMVVDERLVVEYKSVDPLPPIAKRQLRSYLCATRFEVGLLLHFGYRARFYRQIHSNEHRTFGGHRPLATMRMISSIRAIGGRSLVPPWRWKV